MAPKNLVLKIREIFTPKNRSIRHIKINQNTIYEGILIVRNKTIEMEKTVIRKRN